MTASDRGGHHVAHPDGERTIARRRVAEALAAQDRPPFAPDRRGPHPDRAPFRVAYGRRVGDRPRARASLLHRRVVGSERRRAGVDPPFPASTRVANLERDQARPFGHGEAIAHLRGVVRAGGEAHGHTDHRQPVVELYVDPVLRFAHPGDGRQHLAVPDRHGRLHLLVRPGGRYGLELVPSVHAERIVLTVREGVGSDPFRHATVGLGRRKRRHYPGQGENDASCSYVEAHVVGDSRRASRFPVNMTPGR